MSQKYSDLPLREEQQLIYDTGHLEVYRLNKRGVKVRFYSFVLQKTRSFFKCRLCKERISHSVFSEEAEAAESFLMNTCLL